MIIFSQLAFPIGLPLIPVTASAAHNQKPDSIPYTPGAGDEIDMPKKPGNFTFSDRPLSPSPVENKLAGGLAATGRVFQSGNSGQAATNMARSAATAEANAALSQWLNLHGTARVQLNTDNKLRLNNSALDVLLPVYDQQDYFFFTQWGIRRNDNRNTANMGVGARIMHDNWLYGVNTFYDYDMTGKNRRIGVGGEAWADYLKLSVNGYVGLTDWHQSRDFADYNERPANGYDLRAEAYLPAYPQIGGQLMFERYHGDDVALFGKDHRQKDPYALTAGISYTPIPLVTLGVDHRAGKGGQNNSSVNLQFSYQLGQPWSSQIDPSAIGLSRTLAGSRYDLVERNNKIVLDYQKQPTIRLALPERISGESGGTATIAAQVTANNGLKIIEWDSATLMAAGGGLTMTSATEAVLQLPLYQPGNNVHTVNAVAYDTKGNASERAAVRITVNEPNASVAQSQVSAVPASIIANGVSRSQIAITLRDGNNQPVIGRAADLALTLELAPDGTPPATGKAEFSSLTLSELTESPEGVYVAILTAGSESGMASITPILSGQPLNKAQVMLMAAEMDAGKSGMSADRTVILADNQDAANLTFRAVDSNGHPVSGLAVSFAITGDVNASLSAITEDNGIYTARLTGDAPGEVTLMPMVAGERLADASVKLILHAPAALTSIAVNGADFAVDSGFPQSAFKNATFQLQANGNMANNDKFRWESDNGGVTVDQSGNVTINAVTTSEVTITLSDKLLTTNSTKFIFRINKWFEPGTNVIRIFSYAQNYCSNLGSGYTLPSQSVITIDGNNRDASGGVINQWGELKNYGVWGTGHVWLADIAASGQNTSVDIASGSVQEETATTLLRTVCVRAL